MPIFSFKSLFSPFISLSLYFYPCAISRRICPFTRPFKPSLPESLHHSPKCSTVSFLTRFLYRIGQIVPVAILFESSILRIAGYFRQQAPIRQENSIHHPLRRIPRHNPHFAIHWKNFQQPLFPMARDLFTVQPHAILIRSLIIASHGPANPLLKGTHKGIACPVSPYDHIPDLHQNPVSADHTVWPLSHPSHHIVHTADLSLSVPLPPAFPVNPVQRIRDTTGVFSECNVAFKITATLHSLFQTPKRKIL